MGDLDRPTPPSPAFDRLFLDFQSALAGRYSLERELGRGGMGIVYLAREVRLDRLVAVKLLPPARAGDARLRERFLREARTAAKLSHPHIIPIFTVDEVGDFVFFAMAYVAGETLTERVGRRGPLAPTEAARVLREVAWALAYAHSQGLVHRDVKPDNIMLEAASGRALVAASIPFMMATVASFLGRGSGDVALWTFATAVTVVPFGILVNRARRFLGSGFGPEELAVGSAPSSSRDVRSACSSMGADPRCTSACCA